MGKAEGAGTTICASDFLMGAVTECVLRLLFFFLKYLYFGRGHVFEKAIDYFYHYRQMMLLILKINSGFVKYC